MEDRMRETSKKMAIEGYKNLSKDLQGFIESRGLCYFGAGISGIGLDSKVLAKRVLGFIYMENCKEDLRVLEESIDEKRF